MSRRKVEMKIYNYTDQIIYYFYVYIFLMNGSRLEYLSTVPELGGYRTSLTILATDSTSSTTLAMGGLSSNVRSNLYTAYEKLRESFPILLKQIKNSKSILMHIYILFVSNLGMIHLFLRTILGKFLTKIVIFFTIISSSVFKLQSELIMMGKHLWSSSICVTI